MSVTGLDMTDERAQRAVKTFRKMQPQLTAYARAITKNPKVRVVMSNQSAHTDGTFIFYRPPLALGDNLKHDKKLCDKRDPETKLQMCPACEISERVRVNIYHEIGHIAGGTFIDVAASARVDALNQSLREAGHNVSPHTRIETARSYIELAAVINPYLPLINNAVEDARVDLRMMTQRKGIRVMMEASINQIFRDGIERPGQENLPWSEQPLNAQAAIACMLRLSGYTGWESRLHPDVVRHTGMVNVEAILDKLRNSQSAEDTFLLSYPLMEALREHGYFKKPDEIPADPPPPEAGDEDSSDSSDEPGDDAVGDQSSEDASEDPSDADEREQERQSGSDVPDSEESDVPDGDGAEDADDSSSGGDDQGSGDVSPDLEDDAEDSDSDSAGDTQDDAAGDPQEGDEVDDQNADGSGGDLQEDEQEESDSDGGSSSSADSNSTSSESNEADGSDPGEAEGDADSGDTDDSAGGSQAGGDSAPDAGDSDDSADDDGDSAGAGGHHSEGEPSDDESDGDGESREEVGDSEGGTGGTAGPGEEPDQGDTDSGQGEDGTDGEEDRDGDLDSGSQGEGEPQGDGSSGGSTGGDGVEDADLQGRDPGTGEEEGDPDPSEMGEDDASGGSSGDGSDSLPTTGADREGDTQGAEDRQSESADSDGSGRNERDGTGDAGPEQLPSAPEVPGEVPDEAGDDSSEPDRPAEPRPTPSTDQVPPREQAPSDRVPPPDHKHGTDGQPCGCHDCGRYGLPQDVEEAIEASHQQLGHLDNEDSGADDVTLTIMIAQGSHFDTTSINIAGVREFKDGDEYFHDEPNPDIIPEEYVAPALLHTRRAFSDNKKAAVERNLKSGRVNTTSLGRRAWNGDPRLFDKRKVAGKRDYSVLIGIDMSGSTRNSQRTHRIRKAALAQAELCHRAGIRFAVYGHSGGSERIGDDWAFMLDIIQIKTFNQPWDEAARNRMKSISPSGGNVDGHTFEYYRKRLDEENTTDRVLMYYTDGAMPASNRDEETVILERELKICKRQGYVVMGVGINTDSPKQYGLDTYALDSLEDVKGVVLYLEKAIARQA